MTFELCYHRDLYTGPGWLRTGLTFHDVHSSWALAAFQSLLPQWRALEVRSHRLNRSVWVEASSVTLGEEPTYATAYLYRVVVAALQLVGILEPTERNMQSAAVEARERIGAIDIENSDAKNIAHGVNHGRHV